jgi:hypothetical protein
MHNWKGKEMQQKDVRIEMYVRDCFNFGGGGGRE